VAARRGGARALRRTAEHELFVHLVDQMEAARSAGAVTVLVPHRFTTVRMADVIAVLDEGSITEQAPTPAGRTRSCTTCRQERAYRDDHVR
jgi:ATP-binding cassette subfamily B protein